jgi:hypothetical protein
MNKKKKKQAPFSFWFISGESQVYTVGKIGKQKIASTTLLKGHTSPESSKLSAEYTVTRLLGRLTFILSKHSRSVIELSMKIPVLGGLHL